jgi:hypothetical protein
VAELLKEPVLVAPVATTFELPLTTWRAELLPELSLVAEELALFPLPARI